VKILPAYTVHASARAGYLICFCHQSSIATFERATRSWHSLENFTGQKLRNVPNQLAILMKRMRKSTENLI
jgi:hypothetical protein